VAGLVGPPLAGFAGRAYIAGRLPNRPDELVAWIRNPTLVDPETAMPDMGLSEEEAKHVAAYLYTLSPEGS
jgi:cytochrome c1